MNSVRSRMNPQHFSIGKRAWGGKKLWLGGSLRYLHVGEGAGQGASTWPPLLLQSSAQHLKLPLLLPHGGQQGGRTCTLLHSHTESRAQERTESTPERRVGSPNTRIYLKNKYSKAELPKYSKIRSQRGAMHIEESTQLSAHEVQIKRC